ncbi:hypothetical protein LTR15_000343 [Elasticomyces elasticus]|nr:hypothetical protein LTR15_000343 [Elasticomyces elasticus]
MPPKAINWENPHIVIRMLQVLVAILKPETGLTKAQWETVATGMGSEFEGKGDNVAQFYNKKLQHSQLVWAGGEDFPQQVIKLGKAVVKAKAEDELDNPEPKKPRKNGKKDKAETTESAADTSEGADNTGVPGAVAAVDSGAAAVVTSVTGDASATGPGPVANPDETLGDEVDFQ